VAKDKKVKSKDKSEKKDKKPKKAAAAVTKTETKKAEATSGKDIAGKAVKGIQTLSQNPLVADVVAAALVSMAAALKDNGKARQLADGAGDQLKAMSKSAGKDGQIMWDLARDVGRRALEAIVAEQGKGSKGDKGGSKARKGPAS